VQYARSRYRYCLHEQSVSRISAWFICLTILLFHLLVWPIRLFNHSITTSTDQSYCPIVIPVSQNQSTDCLFFLPVLSFLPITLSASSICWINMHVISAHLICLFFLPVFFHGMTTTAWPICGIFSHPLYMSNLFLYMSKLSVLSSLKKTSSCHLPACCVSNLQLDLLSACPLYFEHLHKSTASNLFFSTTNPPVLEIRQRVTRFPTVWPICLHSCTQCQQLHNTNQCWGSGTTHYGSWSPRPGHNVSRSEFSGGFRSGSGS